MGYWTNIVIEGFCFGKENNGIYPCGGHVTSDFCLGAGINKPCPHFAWGSSNERQAAHFVPIRLILIDKFKIWAEDIWTNLRWWFWDRLWFNRRKVEEWIKSIPIATAENNSCVAKWEENRRKAQEEFMEWFEIVEKHRKESEEEEERLN